MTPLHSLVTALVRLLGLYFAVRALDNAAAPFFTMIMQVSVVPEDAEFKLPNPWMMFLPMAAFYLGLAAAIFVMAPKIARRMIGTEVDQEAEVPWHETLLVCTGALIMAWAFVRLTETLYSVVASATHSNGQHSMDNATMVFIFMTAVLFGAGSILVAKFHRVSAWITARRTTSARGADEQSATAGVSK
jgi:hypothetical protein